MHRRTIINEKQTADWPRLRAQLRALDRSAGLSIDWRAASISAAIQAGILAALLWSITAAPSSRASAGNAGISVFNVATVSAPTPALPTRDEALIVPPPIVHVETIGLIATAQPSPSPPSEAPALLGQACDVAFLVGSALANNDDSFSSLVAIDAAAPPISRAMMLWNGDWVLPTPFSDAVSFARLQHSIVEAIAAAPPECQAEPIAGPQFIMINGREAGRSIILVLGSGSWSWGQILPRAGAENELREGEWLPLRDA